MKLDSIHYDFSRIDGYNKPFNFVVSEREDGKSTAFHISKAYKAFKETKRPTIVVRRMGVDITDSYINSLESILNKFNDSPLRFSYLRGSKKDGVVDVKVGQDVIYRVVALSAPLSRSKSLFLANPIYILFDEFICNTRAGEKYLPDEAFRFKEMYTTYNREGETTIKCYFLGNPYSLYSPFFVDLGIDPKAFAKGGVISGANWAAEFHELNPELKEAILRKNPLYQFENAYTRYALKGEAINDSNIRIEPKIPSNYRLCFFFYIDGKYLALYENNAFDFDNQFFVGYADKAGKRRDIYCFDFKDLIDRSALFSYEDRAKLDRFRRAVRTRAVAYESLECDYLVEEIYSSL